MEAVCNLSPGTEGVPKHFWLRWPLMHQLVDRVAPKMETVVPEADVVRVVI
jgi:hypothetical protein